MERLNWHLADQLSRFFDVLVVGPSGSRKLAPPSVQIAEAPLRPLPKFLISALWIAWRKSRKWRPDLVIAGSGLTAPLALLVARICKASSLAYVHGLDVALPNRAYRMAWLPFLRKMDCVIANSSATAALAIANRVDPARVRIVHPGVEIEERPAEISETAALRAHHKLGNVPLLVSVGRLTTRKGLREFVSKSLPEIVAVHPDVVLLVIGGAPSDALHARGQTLESIQSVATQHGVGANVRFLGTVADRASLNVIYRAAVAHVFPVRDIPDDPEGFGMVAIEAAAQGVPTVAFATGGVVDAVSDGVSGRLVPPDDYAAFSGAVVEMLDHARELSESCRRFSQDFSWTNFGNRLAEIANAAPTASERNED